VFSSGRLGGYVGTLVFPIIVELIGIIKTFGLMGPVKLVVLIAFGAFNQKTENVDLEEIEQSMVKNPLAPTFM